MERKIAVDTWTNLRPEVFQLFPATYSMAMAMLGERDRDFISQLSSDRMSDYVIVMHEPDFVIRAKLYTRAEFWQKYEMEWGHAGEVQPSGRLRTIVPRSN